MSKTKTLETLGASLVNEEEDPPQQNCGGGGGGGSAGGAVDPALGATAPNVCPLSAVVPCISSINNKGLKAVSPRLNEAKPNT